MDIYVFAAKCWRHPKNPDTAAAAAAADADGHWWCYDWRRCRGPGWCSARVKWPRRCRRAVDVRRPEVTDTVWSPLLRRMVEERRKSVSMAMGGMTPVIFVGKPSRHVHGFSHIAVHQRTMMLQMMMVVVMMVKWRHYHQSAHAHSATVSLQRQTTCRANAADTSTWHS